MVEAGKHSGDLTRSVIAGSEFEYEFYCNVCQEEGRHLEAEGYCQNCREYLCKTCFVGHCTPRPFRHHMLLSKQNMPKDTSLFAQSKIKKDKSTEKCHIHPAEFIQYYCQDDDTLGCSVCATMNHRNCKGLFYIPDVSGGISDSREFKDLLKDLSSAKDRTTAITNISKDNASDIKKYYQDVIKSIKEFRKQLNTTLDKLENAVKDKADKLKSEDEQKMKIISDNNSTTLKNIEAMIKSLTMLQSSKQECNLFVAIKNIRTATKSLLLRLDQTEQGNNIRKYQFKPGIELQKLLDGKDAYGDISVIDDTDIQTVPSVTTTSTKVRIPLEKGKVKPTFTRQAPSSLHTNLQVMHMDDINVKTKYDIKMCDIRAVVELHLYNGDMLIITDFANCTVKLTCIDTQFLELIAEAELPGQPWDITETDFFRNFAVTLPHQQLIVFVIFTDDGLMVGDSIKVEGACYGIAYRKEQNEFFVSYTRPVKVEILSMGGVVQHTIDTDSTGTQLFRWPHYIAISPDQDTIYVSDRDNHTVTSLTAKGQVKAIYKDDQLKYPTGLATDAKGRINVCCKDNHCIHVMTAQCEKIKVLLTKETELNSDLWALCYCKLTNYLVVGMKSDTIKVFEMT